MVKGGQRSIDNWRVEGLCKFDIQLCLGGGSSREPTAPAVESSGGAPEEGWVFGAVGQSHGA